MAGRGGKRHGCCEEGSERGLTSFMDCKFSKSIDKGKSTRNRFCSVAGLFLPPKYASEEEHHPTNPHLLSVRIVGGIKPFFRALPLRSSGNCESSVLRKSRSNFRTAKHKTSKNQRHAPVDFLHEMCRKERA